MNKSLTSSFETDERNFSSLDPVKVLKTIHCLSQRITERFPNSGLSGVCRELETSCSRSTERIEWIAKPHWPLRILRYALIVTIVLGLIVAIINVQPNELNDLRFVEMIQAFEAGINDVVMISVALFFVWTLEARIKRRRAMQALHELRSIAHVIDMHQLTKDPERLQNTHKKTESSPANHLSAFQMRRYLDYCAEMLSLTGKVAALYLRTLDDAIVVAAVNEIEDLTTGLSRKIWQKIELMRPDAEPVDPPRA
ncbi:MAG: hypothetical protein P1V20_18305 [Verrucomicrobiales bacterium]|nr:hypothetical protein [Verrucomicrobiales bacterium]